MPDIATFRSNVSSILDLGSTADNKIDRALRQSVSFLERTYSFQYMNRFVTFTIDSSKNDPRAYSFPSRPKSIRFVRIKDTSKDTTQFHILDHIAPTELNELPSERPKAFWLDAWDFLWLNSVPDEDYTGEMSYVQYSDWDNFSDSDEPWLLQYAEDLMTAQVIMHVAPFIREPELTQMYKPLRDEGLQALIQAEEDLQREGGLESMQFEARQSA